jgi:beta-glucosidase
LATHRFPDGFLWGVATSAQQIEGGRSCGGRADSVWDRYAMEGRIEDGSNPFRACDHYHRWREDIELMKWLGIGAYRFSTSWSRVMPGGDGSASSEGLEFYETFVDALLEAGIEPFMTLNHWDMPAWLMKHGGWASRDTVPAFVEYADAVTGRLGDRVRHWTTHNEPWCIATLGYEEGCHAPGLTDPAAALPASHHLLLSHGRAVDVIRRNCPGCAVGIVLNLVPAMPATESEADRDAARQFDGYFNRWYLDPLFRGEYPVDSIEDRVRYGHLSADAVANGGLPYVREGDMAEIRIPLDFLGINYYSRSVLTVDGNGKALGVDVVPKEELTEMGWEVYPDGLNDLLVRVARDYSPAEIFITENGIALPDDADDQKRVDDPKRVTYVRDHLLSAHRAIEAGVPVKGYFHWSLMDNFEWGHGYTKRFGLFRVDFETFERTPRSSAHWYRDAIAANAVDDNADTNG